MTTVENRWAVDQTDILNALREADHIKDYCDSETEQKNVKWGEAKQEHCVGNQRQMINQCRIGFVRCNQNTYGLLV